jgi:hypothetical protein
MERERFDALTQLFAAKQSRRGALCALLGAAVLGRGLDAEAKGKSKSSKSRGHDRDKGKGKEKGKGKAKAEQTPANCFTGKTCNLGKGKTATKCDFSHQSLTGLNLAGSNVSGSSFAGSDLSGSSFKSANLSNTCFVDADLTGVSLANANTSGAIFCRTAGVPSNGCDKGTACCPTCDEAHPCDPGQVCCNGRCRSGTCCTSSDCTDPNTPVCVKNTCVGCTSSGQCDTGLTCCPPICTDTDTDPENCGDCGRACDAGEVCSNGFTCQSPNCLPVTEIEADVTLAPNGGLTLTTEGSNGYGAFAFGVPNGTDFSEIVTMESDYQFSTGTCGAGTPRFCVILKNKPECPCAQFPSPCAASGNTGNLIGNNTSGVWFNLCAPAPPINTYADALAAYGGEEIDYIFMVADVSNGAQTVTVEPCITIAAS